MIRRTLALTTLMLLVGAAALAQTPGGAGGGGGAGGRGHGGRGGPSGAPRASTPEASARFPETPTSEVDVIGVIKAVDRAAARVTIAYEANDALNLPAGVMPFDVAKTELLNGAAVGEKVRFRLDSHQVSSLKPFGAAPAQP